ncbi:hypothetical protein [Plectonema radiosum]|uniref:hypothetical protein n=1 Tax=Plectonema radiosum TaxID=945768 RepID=UPI002AD5321D|nr:hypothetical protein [Plectonema radiosum]
MQIEGRLIGFYREYNGDKLLIPEELAQALQQELQRAERAEAELEQLKAKLRELGVDPDTVDL